MNMRLVYTGGGIIAAMLISFLVWVFCLHTETVEPGYHGVIVDKPYFFGHEGVRKDVLNEGRIMMWKTSSLIPVRMTPQSIVVKVDDYSSKDNILLDFETTIQFRITNPVDLLQSFGDAWFDNNIRNQYLAIVREAVKKKTMTEMMSDVSAAQQVDNEVTTGLQKLVTDGKLPLEVINVSMGRAKPNETVLHQMNETAAQQQRKKTLIEAEQAEIQREREQIAKAKADNAYRNSIGLNPEQFIHLEAIKRFAETCAKSTCIVGAPGIPVTLGQK